MFHMFESVALEDTVIKPVTVLLVVLSMNVVPDAVEIVVDVEFNGARTVIFDAFNDGSSVRLLVMKVGWLDMLLYYKEAKDLLQY